jgi:fatty-acyl-CoA synthase
MVGFDVPALYLGTTGDPKASSTIIAARISARWAALLSGSGLTAYIFGRTDVHCSSWTYTWAVTAVGGMHICLRRVDPRRSFRRYAITT